MIYLARVIKTIQRDAKTEEVFDAKGQNHAAASAPRCPKRMSCNRLKNDVGRRGHSDMARADGCFPPPFSFPSFSTPTPPPVTTHAPPPTPPDERRKKERSSDKVTFFFFFCVRAWFCLPVVSPVVWVKVVGFRRFPCDGPHSCSCSVAPWGHCSIAPWGHSCVAPWGHSYVLASLKREETELQSVLWGTVVLSSKVSKDHKKAVRQDNYLCIHTAPE